MIREIEFRGKNIESGEWLYGSHFTDSGEDYIIPQDILGIKDYEEYQVDQNTIGQFTGLRDKNGNKIFERDVVEVTSMRYGYGDFMEKMLCEIVYDNDLCCFDFLTPDCQRCMCSTIPDAEIEVIGNIHDNPELLDKKE